MTGHSTTESRMAETFFEASQKQENFCQVTENVSSVFEDSKALTFTNENCVTK